VNPEGSVPHVPDLPSAKISAILPAATPTKVTASEVVPRAAVVVVIPVDATCAIVIGTPPLYYARVKSISPMAIVKVSPELVVLLADSAPYAILVPPFSKIAIPPIVAAGMFVNVTAVVLVAVSPVTENVTAWRA
jgi:hypothetical protein